jgi:hypothetical protein
MKQILLWFGFIKPTSCENQKLLVSFKSTYPENQPAYQDWVNEFRVSMLHGKHAVHF